MSRLSTRTIDDITAPSTLTTLADRRNGVRGSFKVIIVAADEQSSLSRAYKMGFILRFICGFVSGKFLILHPREP